MLIRQEIVVRRLIFNDKSLLDSPVVPTITTRLGNCFTQSRKLFDPQGISNDHSVRSIFQLTAINLESPPRIKPPESSTVELRP